MITDGSSLRLEEREGGWALAGPGSADFMLVNEYLAHLGDRNYSVRTVRAYGFDLLAFCRWLVTEDIALTAVTTDVLLVAGQVTLYWMQASALRWTKAVASGANWLMTPP